MISVGHLEQEFEVTTEYFSPRVIAMANGQYVKLSKAKGEFVWHADEDEFFLIHRDFHVIPRGAEHFPYAPEESWIVFVEPAGTKHTGDAPSARAKSIEAQTAHLQHRR